MPGRRRPAPSFDLKKFVEVHRKQVWECGKFPGGKFIRCLVCPPSQHARIIVTNWRVSRPLTRHESQAVHLDYMTRKGFGHLLPCPIDAAPDEEPCCGLDVNDVRFNLTFASKVGGGSSDFWFACVVLCGIYYIECDNADDVLHNPFPTHDVPVYTYCIPFPSPSVYQSMPFQYSTFHSKCNCDRPQNFHRVLQPHR